MNRTFTAFTLLLIVLACGCGHQTHVAVDKQSVKTDPRPATDPTADANQVGRIYIPKDINDCFVELERKLSPEDLKRLKESTVGDLAGYHFGLGLWMRNYWGLWSGSRLQKYFLDLGFTDPDSMSGAIIACFWHHLNNRPIRLEETAEMNRYYNKVSKKPTDCTCPEHRAPLELFYGLYGGMTKEGRSLPRWVHVARCSRSSEIWAYEYELAWYKPEGTLRQRIEELERIDEFLAQRSESRSKGSKSISIAPIVDEFEAGVFSRPESYRQNSYVVPLEEAFPKQ